jgi:hypothetical protein
MRTTTRRIALVAGVALLLALTGCVRFQADLRIGPDDTVDGELVVAAVVGDGEDGRDQAEDAAARIEAELLAGLRGAAGVTRTVYDEDGYLGSRFRFEDTPIDAFHGGSSEGSLTLERVGDEYVVAGTLDFTPDDEETVGEDDDTSNVTVAVTFPGPVVSSNGEVSGHTVRWSTTPEARLDLEARGSAIPTGPPLWAWLVAGGALLVIVAAAAVVVVRVRKQRPPVL